MNFKSYCDKKLLFEAFIQQNYNRFQGYVLKKMAQNLGYNSVNDFMSAEQDKLVNIMRAYREVIKDRFGVDDTGKPNSDADVPWETEEPGHKEFVDIIIKDIENKLKSSDQMAAQS